MGFLLGTDRGVALNGRVADRGGRGGPAGDDTRKLKAGAGAAGGVGEKR